VKVFLFTYNFLSPEKTGSMVWAVIYLWGKQTTKRKVPKSLWKLGMKETDIFMAAML
jgi:hypothetical protein